MNLENKRIAIVGLGYVGLPLAIAFANKFETIGFDINNDRIVQLQNGDDCVALGFPIANTQLRTLTFSFAT